LHAGARFASEEFFSFGSPSFPIARIERLHNGISRLSDENEASSGAQNGIRISEKKEKNVADPAQEA